MTPQDAEYITLYYRGKETDALSAAMRVIFRRGMARYHARLELAGPALLAVAEEIANDPRCDLVSSERRIRLYHAITLAGGNLGDQPLRDYRLSKAVRYITRDFGKLR